MLKREAFAIELEKRGIKEPDFLREDWFSKGWDAANKNNNRPLTENMKAICNRLRTGEYSGMDVMQARLYIENGSIGKYPHNFCTVCGKRASKDDFSVHTCTPPEGCTFS